MSECSSSQDGFGNENEVVEIIGDQASNDSAVGRLNLSSIHMWALGVCIAISGTFYAWNIGLEAGLGTYAVARVLVSLAFIALILSISELSSGLPFAGGAYGIARVTLGPFIGYMVACYDCMETVVACSALVYSFAKTVVTVGDINSTWEPGIWALFYILYVAVHSWGGRLFWNSMMALAIGNLIIVVIYLLGAARYANLAENAPWPNSSSEHTAWFRGGLYIFVRFLPSSCNGFTCIECVNLACKDVQNPKRDIPRGLVSSVLTQSSFCLAAVFVTASLSPGIVAASKASAPFTEGFMKIFNCSANQAAVISLPSLCAAAFGRMFCYGRQIGAMGRSGMLNPFFGQELETRHTPFYGLVLGSAVGFVLCLISYFEESVGLVQMTQMAHLSAYTTYFAQLSSFILFQGTFSIIKREFRSPFGIAGAVYAIFWFALCFISVAFFQDNNFAITGYSIYTVAALIYYFAVVRYRQYFSDEEKRILFRAHLVKNNASRAAKLRKGKYAASSASSIGGGAGGACTSRHSVHPVSTPKYAATGQIRKSGSMSSLSEHGGTGVDLQNIPQRSLRSVPSDDRGRLSPTPHVREVGNESSGIGLSVPDTAIDAPSSSRQPSKRESAGTFSLFNTLSDRISAAGWAWYGGSERVCVSPLKTDDSSMEDIEADTFRGSVRRKPVNSNLIKHPAEASLRGITTNVSSGEPHSDPSREEVETSATVRTDTDNNLTAATETATDTVTATAATSFAEGGTSPSAATAE